MRPKYHLNKERHYSHRAGWLRAAVLGANDGIISTSSLILGFAMSGSDTHTIFLAGLAGLFAGATSMAAGEYVSVSSQFDTEKADLKRERAEIAADFESETRELANMYIKRGLSSELAKQVARQLMAHDALGAHAREELGITNHTIARPLQAAVSSAASFTTGALVPVLVAVVSPPQLLPGLVIASTICLLALLGVLAARLGGSKPWRSAVRVSFWGAIAMAITSLVGFWSGK